MGNRTLEKWTEGKRYGMVPFDGSYWCIVWNLKGKWLCTDILGRSYYSPMTNTSLYWKVSGEQEYRDDGIIVYYRWKVPLLFI